MHIVLIAPIMFDLGVYTIAPQLKAKGHTVKLLFIPELMQDCLTPHPLSKKSINRISGFLKPADLIGINCLSENYLKTAAFVGSLKAVMDKPIIWGGIHATLNPQDCIKHADIVCVGEGEAAMLELVDKMSANERTDNIDNLIFKNSFSSSKCLKLRPPIDLNSLLPFDYDLDFQYVAEGRNIRTVKEGDFRGCFFSYSSRGCPFRCSYCCNQIMLDGAYKGSDYCRQRSVDKIINELKEVKSRFKTCSVVWFNEADFLHGKDQGQIEEFSGKYKKEIDIPFCIWTNPISIREDAVASLKAAGFKGTNIGTINANQQIQGGIFNRPVPAQLYARAANILKKYNVSTEYDFILCNPYESNENIVNDINLIRSLPTPFKTVIYSLTYFPGTNLYKRAVDDGIIFKDSPVNSYTKAAYKSWLFSKDTVYLNAVASMMRGVADKKSFLKIKCYGFLPDAILKVLLAGPLQKMFNLSVFRLFVYPAIGNFIMFAYKALDRTANFLKKFYRLRLAS